MSDYFEIRGFPALHPLFPALLLPLPRDTRDNQRKKERYRIEARIEAQLIQDNRVLGTRIRTRTTKVPEIQDVEDTKYLDGTPIPYSPNSLAELAQTLGGWPLGGYFQGHRGDF